MNTILTDDELPPLLPQDHPEPHSMRWSDPELRAIRARDRLVEAAVLAKLREQVPRPCHVFNLTKEGNYTEWEPTTMAFALPDGKHALYTAAPLPAVVQVPRISAERSAAYDNIDRFLRNNLDDTDYATFSRDLETVLAAAPEAPAQGEFVHDPACKMCGGRGYYVAGYSGREDDGNAPIHEECDCWIPNPQAPAQPSVPAPWREAMKVMREALEDARRFIVNGVEFGYIRMPDPDTPDSAHETEPNIRAAIALADSLEGGE